MCSPARPRNGNQTKSNLDFHLRRPPASMIGGRTTCSFVSDHVGARSMPAVSVEKRPVAPEVALDGRGDSNPQPKQAPTGERKARSGAFVSRHANGPMGGNTRA